MHTRILIPVFLLSFCSVAIAQPQQTFVKSFDPNPQNTFGADKGINIWSIGHFVYVVNGYINTQGGRSNQIFKIDADSREIVKQIPLEGPQGDLAISERGGYCITADDHVLLTGEWRDYTVTRTRTFIAKLDKDLNIEWINYFPDLSDLHIYGDAVAETASGNILLYFTEGEPTVPNNPWAINQCWTRIMQTNSSGQLIDVKTVADTFSQTVGYGHLGRGADNNFILSSTAIGYYYHPILGTYLYNAILHKIDEDANPIWSRALNYTKFDNQEPVATTLLDGGAAVMWRKDTFCSNPDVANEFSFLQRLNGAGQTQWTHEWHDVTIRTVYRIITATNGDILGCGYYSNDGEKGKTWLFRATPDGDILWERHYSDSIQRPWSPQFEMLDLCEMADGRIAAAGIVFDLNATGSLNLNIGVLMMDANGCLSPDCSGLTHYITGASDIVIRRPSLPQLICHPNPASDYITIQLPDIPVSLQKNLELRCYDVQGNTVQKINWRNSENNQTITVGQWQSGTYRLVFWADNIPVSSGNVIVQR